MSTIHIVEMNTSMRIGTYTINADTTVKQLKTIMLGEEGTGNEDRLSIILGGKIRDDSELILSLVGNGGSAVVRFGPVPTEGGRRRRRNTRRRKNTRRH